MDEIPTSRTLLSHATNHYYRSQTTLDAEAYGRGSLRRGCSVCPSEA